METVSTTNRFRRSLYSLNSTTVGSNNQQRPEHEQRLFDIYKREGDSFFYKRKYKKAVNSYSLALYQKAQVLCSLGHYDTALLFFHKGHRLNPDAPGFAEGVDKAQKALAQLTPGRRMKTTDLDDFSFYIPRRPMFTRRFKPLPNCKTEQEPDSAPLSPSFSARRRMCKLASLELQKKTPSTLDRIPHPPERDGVKHSVPKANGSAQPSMRDVLSQLYTDKAYFEKILRDMESSGRFQEEVGHMAGDGLAFIAERMLFWARFGAPDPSASAADVCFTTRGAHMDGDVGLQPCLSARQRQSRNASSGENAVTPEAYEYDMTSRSAGGGEAKAVTWANLEEASNNIQDQEMDTDGQQKLSGKVQPDGGKSRVSGDVPKTQRRLRKRRKRKATKEEDLTMLSSLDAEKLKFNFDTYRPSPSLQQPHQRKPLVPPLVRSLDELSTDEWDSEWDEWEEEDIEAANKPDRHQDGEGIQAGVGGDTAFLSSDMTAREGADSTAEKETDSVRLYLVRAIGDIRAEFDKGGYLMVREKVINVLTDLDKYKEDFMANKLDLVATLHSFLGNAYLEIGDLDLALQHHREDLRIGQEMKNSKLTSRALGNVGRTYVARKDYYTALECFAGKSKHVSTPLVKAWLYHEISNCFLQLRHYEFARDAAAKALGIAIQVCSSVYQLQAAVLLAVCEVQLKKYHQAHDHFTLALEQARLREDVKAESSIKSALQQVNHKLAQVAKESHTANDTMGQAHHEKSLRNSSDDEEDPELADLRESDTEGMEKQEHDVITGAKALAALSATVTQPLPPTATQAPPTPRRVDRAQQQHVDAQASAPPSGQGRSSPAPDEEQSRGLQEPLDQPQERLPADGTTETALPEHRTEEDSNQRELTDGEKEDYEKEEEGRTPSVDPVVRHLAIELKGIEEALKAEDPEGVLVKAQAALDSYTEEELEEESYLPLVAKLHSFLGTAAMMLENYEKSLCHHLKDLGIGEHTKDREIQSRALENLGRVHVLQRHYDKALESYVKRLKLDRDAETSARIFHEIANCFFYMQHFAHARDSARLAVQHGAECGNSLIQLQSTVLMAVCHVKESRRDEACTSFEEALAVAVERDDEEAEAAIREAIRSLRNKVQLAVDKFKGLVRGRRMANKFFPMTDWVSHILHNKLGADQPGNKVIRGPGFTLEKELPKWRHF